MEIEERYCVPGGAGNESGECWDNAWDLDDAATNLVAGQRLNVMGSFSGYGGDIIFANNVTADKPIIIRGGEFDPSIGFDPSIPLSEGFAYIDMGAFVFRVSGDFIFAEGLNITGTNTSYVCYVEGDGACVYRCKFVNTNEGNFLAYALYLLDAQAINCNCQTNAINAVTNAIYINRGMVNGCYAESASGGIELGSTYRPDAVTNCIIVGTNQTAGKHGITIDNLSAWGGILLISSNTIYNFDDAIHSVKMPDVTETTIVGIYNNLAHTMLGYGFDTDDREKTGIFAVGNACYNTADDSRFNRLLTCPNTDHIQCTADPCINVVGGNFALNNVAGGGSLLRGGAVWNNSQKF